ncbi:hypothetical protein AUK11_00260 [bacterium CG2_30_37_16]|nr:MAG: hypothetical protein AUK11_00260 [bacterium CG2_30_37_16]PIP30654.1 MAG: hypothetical protein COX25_03625 [bacterium (Candidatus Howlettbacteria) CG23_combo_of_CG06-09_8_20_14_all_37_9]PIX99601.1 MAG: hypothetical protein COZ22_02135 [bacterium (Candidatus Howlettbacteria) CG_4_10_14_3_um_filter_37_10]PJB05398.1 MAG: hypothetical protein CO123_04250 [bacterium (Candidatus Howlettbacteria) CG_4_9_14_3_um_filter_37_10]
MERPYDDLNEGLGMYDLLCKYESDPFSVGESIRRQNLFIITLHGRLVFFQETERIANSHYLETIRKKLEKALLEDIKKLTTEDLLKLIKKYLHDDYGLFSLHGAHLLSQSLDPSYKLIGNNEFELISELVELENS